MKTKALLVFIIVIAVSFISCSVTKYTHSEVMDMEVLNQTQYGIISKYGNPTQRRIMAVSDDSEEIPDEIWIYNLTKSKNTWADRKNAGKPPVSSESYGGGSMASSFDRYLAIKFHNGRVVKWETKGVDFSSKGAGGGGGSTIKVMLALYIVIMAVGLSVLLGTRQVY
jgi:hypothetical protein